MTGAIIVIGRRLPRDSGGGGGFSYWGYGFDETGGYTAYPELYPTPLEGGGGSWENDLYEVHTARCNSPSDAAKSISNTIMATEGSLHDWTDSEYGATIVQTGDGRFGAFNNKVYTDYSPLYVNVGSLSPNAGTIGGLIHSHPPSADHSANLEARYPSDEDIEWMSQLVNDGVFPPTASLFILDGFGSVREFPYSAIHNYTNANMTREQRLNGAALPSSITTANCVDL